VCLRIGRWQTSTSGVRPRAPVVMSDRAARGLAPSNLLERRHVGRRGEVAKPSRDDRHASEAAGAIPRPSVHSSVEGASAPSELRAFDEAWKEIGAPRRVETPDASRRRQRVTFPPFARKTTPRARGARRGPRSKARQDWRAPVPNRPQPRPQGRPAAFDPAVRSRARSSCASSNAHDPSRSSRPRASAGVTRGESRDDHLGRQPVRLRCTCT